MAHLSLADVSRHLTKDIIERAFKLRVNADDEVQHVEVTIGAPIGEGLLSAVYRLKVIGRNHSTYFFVKGIINDYLVRKTLSSVEYLKREADFYCKILPKLKELQKSTGGKERIQNNIPVCYNFFSNGCDDYLLLEDMSEKNCIALSQYPMVEQRDMILKALAHLHAVSLALRIKQPQEFDKIAEAVPEIYYKPNNHDWYSKYLQNAIDIDIAVIKKYECPSSDYYVKFMQLVNTDVYSEMTRLVTTRGDHPVFTHGDAWCRNFLCSEDRAIAIDFQFYRCSSAVIDLAYFIMMSSSSFRNKEDFMKAVESYHSGLTYYLKDMRLDVGEIYSWDTLMDELKKYGKFGMLAALSSIPLLLSDKYDVLQYSELKYSDMDKIPLEELWRLSPLEGKEQEMKLINAVRVSVDLGLI